MPTQLTTLEKQEDAGDLHDSTTPQERWAMTWELSQSLYEFKDRNIVKPRLQRHIVRVHRRES